MGSTTESNLKPPVAPSISTEELAANVEGRTRAITVLSAVRPFFSCWLRFIYFVSRYVPAATSPLRKLSFIHFARWNLLTRIPENGFQQKPEHLNSTYLMFTSNFNGTWAQYIDAFSYVVRSGMSLIWGSSYGFPGPMPVKPFKDYIRRNEFVASHYYSAYPKASTTVILSALELDIRLAQFQRDTVGVSAGQFHVQYQKFITDVQRYV